MAELPSKARVVVIGAGIVGNCLVGHLADLGWTDIVLLDKGPLPNPGGSTGHASNFIFPTDHNKEMAVLTPGEPTAIRSDGCQHRVWWHRGRPNAGEDGRNYGAG
jgi:glycine/D-amino acid oxidase-like deaminating enzyme